MFLADMYGQTCWEADFSVPLALIVGGEAEGASDEARRLATQIIGGEAEGSSQQARELTDSIVSIPMPGEVESLNASVAGAVLMFEVVRQRN